MPLGNLLFDGAQAPTVSHHPSPCSAYQPESMQKYSAPALAAALMSGHLDHILGDLDLARGAGGPVDVAAVLRERLAPG